jgi:hypothetical protein
MGVSPLILFVYVKPPQNLGELRPCAGKHRTYAGGTDMQNPGDLSVVETLDVRQPKGIALVQCRGPDRGNSPLKPQAALRVALPVCAIFDDHG